MRPLARPLLFAFLGVLFVAGPAAAWRIDGKVYCDDGDNVIDSGDTPLDGVVVKAVADNGMGATFMDTTGDAVPVSPAVPGYYRISDIPDAPDTYIVMILSGLPAGASVIIPVGGSYSVSLTEESQNRTKNFLVSPCVSSTTSSTSSTTNTSNSPSTSTSSTSSTSSTTSTSGTSATSTSATSTSATSTSATSTSASSSSTTSTSTTSTTLGTTPLELCETTVDHLKCYRTRRITAFTPKNVTLMDQFETANMNVLRPYRLCNPVDKNDEGIIDPTEHQMCYQIRDQVAGARFRHKDVLIENQFGTQTLVVNRPETLCVPAEKNGINSDLNGDRMKCYRVNQKVGEPDFVPITVNLEDQFEIKDTVVLKPILLCNPTELEGGPPVTSPECHLVCYRITDVEGQPDFIPVPVTVQDEFYDLSVNAFRGECRQVSLLCVPSLKTELP